MDIDIEQLREDIKNELYGAFFIGNFGGALISSFEIDNMDDIELIDYAQKHGINLENYIIYT